ncbi:MAG: DNA helicase, partial [Chloroflexi bacterium]|nr:DNA helicase [Chloroflexota bacterium]
YYIASLNIEHEYYDLTGKYAPFEGIALVDTLDLKEKPQMEMKLFVEENTERIRRQEEAPINVIIGNPPYNVGQLNENDNNRNRSYRAGKSDINPGVDDRIEATFVADSKATNKIALYDM